MKRKPVIIRVGADTDLEIDFSRMTATTKRKLLIHGLRSRLHDIGARFPRDSQDRVDAAVRLLHSMYRKEQ